MPADSNPLPCGARIAVVERRVHGPKGGLYVVAARVAKTIKANAGIKNNRFETRLKFSLVCMHSLSLRNMVVHLPFVLRVFLWLKIFALVLREQANDPVTGNIDGAA